MHEKKRQARELINVFKGDDYIYGLDCFDRLGGQAAALGRRAAVVISGVGKDWAAPVHQAVRRSLRAASVTVAGEFIPGAAPNSPREDVIRVAAALHERQPDVVVSVGGGSGIDGTKTSVAYHALGDLHPDLMDYFGVGRVSAMLDQSGRRLLPLVAVQLASGSAAHLTKYSNITYQDLVQKLLIIDEAVTPPKALFDYQTTQSMSPEFTMDGALDGVAHCLETYYGASADKESTLHPISLLGIDLIVNHLHRACRDGKDREAREALGLGTDLGGYAIMVGGTNGAHLTSFSLVDVLSHGRACAIMNPYYTVFFAPAIEPALRVVGQIYQDAGLCDVDLDRLSGRALGEAVARAMFALSRRIGFPTSLSDLPAFTDTHIERALAAARDPQLKMKLENMPIPMTTDMIDEYMGAVLLAAKEEELGLIKSV